MNKTVITLILVIGILLAGIAYVLGKYGLFTTPRSQKQNNVAVVTLTTTPIATASATPTIVQKVINAGGFSPFPKYKITVPDGWQDKKETPAPNSERIILTKDVYQVSILQSAFGGGTCLYPGDPTVEGPSVVYTNFVDLTDKSGDNFRLSYIKDGYAVCQKTQYGWANPTLYGAIDVKSPNIPAAETLSEIKSIISSIEKR